MRIALFVYACQPGAGSEPGIGWQYVNMVGQDHEVVAFTRESNRAAIEAVPTPPGVTWEFLAIPERVGPAGLGSNWFVANAVAWLHRAVDRAVEIHRDQPFDLSHFVTFTACWMPTPFWKLDIPHVHGPLTGGEADHPGFHPFPGSARVRRMARSLGFRALMLSRDWRRSLSRSSTLTVCASQTVADIVSAAGASHVAMFRPPFSATRDLIADLEQIRLETPAEPGLVVMSGRQLTWKGHDLGVRAFAELAAERPDVRLCVVGDGPKHRLLEGIVRRHGISSRVEFLPDADRETERRLIAASELFLFPSRRDAGASLVPLALFLGTRIVGFELPVTLSSVGSLGFLARPDGPAGPSGELAAALRRALATDRADGQAERVERGHHLLDIDEATQDLEQWYERAMAANGVGDELDLRDT